MSMRWECTSGWKHDNRFERSWGASSLGQAGVDDGDELASIGGKAAARRSTSSVANPILAPVSLKSLTVSIRSRYAPHNVFCDIDGVGDDWRRPSHGGSCGSRDHRPG